MTLFQMFFNFQLDLSIQCNVKKKYNVNIPMCVINNFSPLYSKRALNFHLLTHKKME